MTIICAYYDTEEQLVYLGSNSRSRRGGTIIPGDSSKWSFYGDWAMATTGGGLPSDLVEARREKFPQSPDAHEVVRFIRKSYEITGFGEKEDGAQDYNCSSILVHSSGKIFDVDGTLSLAEVNPGAFWALGSGMDYALGAAFVAKQRGYAAREMMQLALEAAIEIDTYSPGQPNILTKTVAA